MHMLRYALAAVFTIFATACVVPAAEDDPIAVEMEMEPATVIPDAPRRLLGPFFMARRDYRRCPFPKCGGYFVKLVNREVTRCTDGSIAGECYVAGIDLDALRLDRARFQRFTEALGTGKAIVRGTMVEKTDELARVSFGWLVASEGFWGRTGHTPEGSFYRVKHNGVICVTWPCLSYDAALLNSSEKCAMAGVRLEDAGAEGETLRDGYRALRTPGGLLVAGTGRTVTGPAGSATELSAAEFYTRAGP